jgi:hypothetical protein
VVNQSIAIAGMLDAPRRAGERIPEGDETTPTGPATQEPTPGPRDAEPPDAGLIQIRIRDLRQLFDTLDPAPFLERDLDDRMSEYVESCADEIPGHVPLRLQVHVPAAQIDAEQSEMVQVAVNRHYAHQADLARHRFRRMLRDGRRSLWIGLLALAACMLIADLAASSGSRLVQVLGEGLVIGGWVAMWRPIEILLYDWWPLRRQIRDRERLRDMTVELRAEG